MYLNANPDFPENGITYADEELNDECCSLLKNFLISRYPIVEVMDIVIEPDRVFHAFDRIITHMGFQERVQVLRKKHSVFLIRKYS